MKKQYLYVAVDIGCIECGEESAVLGVFKTRQQALRVCDEHAERQRENWSGQHSFEVHRVDGINVEMRIDYV